MLLRNIIFFTFFLLIFISCQKEQIQLENDINAIEEYLNNNNLSAIKDADANYFYSINNSGQDSIYPINNSSLILEVEFSAKDLDGNIYASKDGENRFIALDNSIIGWQLALPRISIGDNIILYLPSRLAYGEDGTDIIPSNTNLIFDIDLINIHPHF